MTNKVYQVSGYWKDDKTELRGLICSMDSTPEGYSDDDIFFYGLSEKDMKSSSQGDANDFVITHYKLIN